MKKLDHFDLMMIAYCLILLIIGAVFIGHEISEISHSQKERDAQRIIKNCNKLITNNNYDK